MATIKLLKYFSLQNWFFPKQRCTDKDLRLCICCVMTCYIRNCFIIVRSCIFVLNWYKFIEWPCALLYQTHMHTYFELANYLIQNWDASITNSTIKMMLSLTKGTNCNNPRGQWHMHTYGCIMKEM